MVRYKCDACKEVMETVEPNAPVPETCPRCAAAGKTRPVLFWHQLGVAAIKLFVFVLAAFIGFLLLAILMAFIRGVSGGAVGRSGDRITTVLWIAGVAGLGWFGWRVRRWIM